MNNNYEKYTRQEMSDIGKNKGFYFIENSYGEYFEIAKDDLVDFIIAESKRHDQRVNLQVYVSAKDEPILTTIGYYLDKVNSKLRDEIIGRLIKLQTRQEEPKKVKVFDNEIFYQMDIQEFGEEEGKTIQFDRFFKQYYEDENEMEAE